MAREKENGCTRTVSSNLLFLCTVSLIFSRMSSSKNINNKAIVKQSFWRVKLFKAVVQLVDLVLRKDKKCALPEYFFRYWDFFVNIKFFEDLKSKYNGVEIMKDAKQKKVILKGRGGPYYNASNECENVLPKLLVQKMTLEDSRMWDAIDGNEQHLKEIMVLKKIKAKVCFDQY